jgi:hypothetical protein
MLADIEKFTVNLRAPTNSSVYKDTTLWIVYKTIENNPNITINKICFLLNKEYNIPIGVSKAAILSLTSPSFFGVVTHFYRPNTPNEMAHLHLKSENKWTGVFKLWLNKIKVTNPELGIFIPPIYIHKKTNIIRNI